MRSALAIVGGLVKAWLAVFGFIAVITGLALALFAALSFPFTKAVGGL